jgi:hypothetical protein
MLRHLVGQTSTHELQITHRILSICHVFSFTSTQIAPVGHFLWQERHVMQLSGSISMWPLVMAALFAGRIGYISVAGRENRLLMAVLVILRITIDHHLSEQPMQGSIDRTITGTSASWQPVNIFTRGGMLVNVGVLTLERTRFFFPFPLT